MWPNTTDLLGSRNLSQYSTDEEMKSDLYPSFPLLPQANDFDSKVLFVFGYKMGSICLSH
jgi:hypothetical protein